MFVTIVKILIIFGKDTNTSLMSILFVLIVTHFPMRRINIKKYTHIQDTSKTRNFFLNLIHKIYNIIYIVQVNKLYICPKFLYC